MQNGEYKEILFEIFDELGFTEPEKQKALEGFKKKLASTLFDSVKVGLSWSEIDWADKHAGVFDPRDPKIIEMQKTIQKLYPKEALSEKGKVLFKKILAEYIDFMTRELNLGLEKVFRLKSIAEKV